MVHACHARNARRMHANPCHTSGMEPFVNVRLPVSLWELVKTAATAERRSASAELAALVERALRTAVPAKPGADQTLATLADFRAITTTSSASIESRAADAVAALEPRSTDWRAG